MPRINEGDILYHASYTKVENIDLSKCRQARDFGKGFYVTTSLEQAKTFVRSSVKKAIARKLLPQDTDTGYVNVYKVASTNSINEYDFSDADVNWLHYVAGNRDETLFKDEVANLGRYNCIGGKIANDKTAATLNDYIDYEFGTPGEKIADDTCITLLLPNRLEDQYCFKDEEAIKSLEFMEAIEVKI